MDPEVESSDKLEFINTICNLVDSRVITASEGKRFVQPVINSLLFQYKEENNDKEW